MQQRGFSRTATAHQGHEVTRFFQNVDISETEPAVLELEGDIGCLEGSTAVVTECFELVQDLAIIDRIVLVPTEEAADAEHSDFARPHRYAIQKYIRVADIFNKEQIRLFEIQYGNQAVKMWPDQVMCALKGSGR